MGNCYGKKSFNNKVGLEPPMKKDISEIISKATPLAKPSPSEEQSMIKELANRGQDPSTSIGRVAFTIDYKEGCSSRIPSRLAGRLDGTLDEGRQSTIGFVYTEAEKELMAELYRDDILREKREKAWKEDLKLYDAAMRRQNVGVCKDLKLYDAAMRRQNVGVCKDLKLYDAAMRRQHVGVCKDWKTEAKLDKATPNIAERKQKVKTMADDARSRAASRMNN